MVSFEGNAMSKRQDQGGWKDSGFADRLKELRKEAGLTQEELARRAGCNKFTVAKLEAGKQVPAWPLVLALAEAFGRDCTALMSNEDRQKALLLRWEESQDRGESVSPEELCRDSPELLAGVKAQIRMLTTSAPALDHEGKTAKLLNRIKPSDESALNDLLNHTCDRLRQLAQRMLKGFPYVGRWEQTDDVLQNALVRLYQVVKADPPNTTRHFYNLAGLAIRRELLVLSHQHSGLDQHTEGTDAALAGVVDRSSEEPSSAAEWAEFHQRVDALPDEEREVFGLLWYQALNQQQAAEIMGVSVRTVKRLWQSARLTLARALSNDPHPPAPVDKIT